MKQQNLTHQEQVDRYAYSMKQKYLNEIEEDLQISNDQQFQQTTQVDFKQFIVKGNHFIDKSVFIELFLNIKCVIFSINRPSGFGKSMNATMLKTFLHPQIDKKLAQENQKIFKGGKIGQIILPQLQIARISQGKYLQQFGKHPIIYLTLQKPKIKNFQYCKRQIIKQIRKVCHSFYYLNVITKYQEFLLQIQKEKNSVNFASWLGILADILEDFHKKKSSFLIIDDFSIMLEAFLESNVSKQEIIKLHTFMSQICHKFDDQFKGRKVLVTGKIDFLGKCNRSFQKYTITDSQKMWQCFGFSEKEINSYMCSIDLNKHNKQKIMQQMKCWYNGYFVKLCYVDFNMSNIILFHPQSTIKYLSKLTKSKKFIKPKCQLSKVQYQPIIKFVIRLCQSSIQGLTYLTNIFNSFTNITQNKKLSNRFFTVPDTNDLIQLIYHQGMKNKQLQLKRIQQICTYLLISYGVITGYYCLPITRPNILQTFIPNLQMMKLFQQTIRQQISQNNIIRNFKPIAIQSSIDFKQKIQQCLKNWTTLMDSPNQRNFNSIVYIRYGLSHNITHHSYLEKKINKRTDSGIADSIFYPLKNHPVSYIHEYKYVKNFNPESIVVEEEEEEKEGQEGEKGKRERERESIQNQAYWQTLCKNYLAWPISQNQKSNKNSKHIKKIVIRSIIFYNETEDPTLKFNLHIDQIQFSISQAKTVLEFFSLQEVQGFMKSQQKVNYNLVGQKILNFSRNKTLDELLIQLKTIKSKDVKQFYKKKQLQTKKSFDYFMILREVPNLRKINVKLLVEKNQIFKFSPEQLQKISYKDQLLSLDQATIINKKLKKIFNDSKYFKIQTQMGKPTKKIKQSKQDDQNESN